MYKPTMVEIKALSGGWTSSILAIRVVEHTDRGLGYDPVTLVTQKVI